MNKYLFLAIVFLFSCSTPSFSEVSVSDLEAIKKIEAGIVTVAEYPEAHNVQKCDKEGTKKLSHILSSHDKHKADDIKSKDICYETCRTLAFNAPSEALQCNRDCNDLNRQREDNAGDEITKNASLGALGLIVLKALGGI